MASTDGRRAAVFRSILLTNTNPRHQYDVGADGIFLLNQTVSDGTSPITLLQNWKPPAK